MPSPGSGVLRAVRAGALSAAVVGLSLIAHTLAGGHTPGAAPLFVMAVVTAAVMFALARHRAGFVPTAVVLGIGEFGFHAVFEATTGLDAPHHGSAAHAAAGGDPAWLMLAAHAVATLATAAMLTWGDAIVWRLWSWLTRPSRSPEALPALTWDAARVVVPASRAVPTPVPGIGAGMRRGPPAVFALS